CRGTRAIRTRALSIGKRRLIGGRDYRAGAGLRQRPLRAHHAGVPRSGGVSEGDDRRGTEPRRSRLHGEAAAPGGGGAEFSAGYCRLRGEIQLWTSRRTVGAGNKTFGSANGR